MCRVNDTEDGHRITCKTTNDCSDKDEFIQYQQQVLEQVKIGSYDSVPEVAFDRDTEIAGLS